MTTITGGASTMSRQPGRRPALPGAENTISVSGKGCQVQLLSGKTLIDMPMGQHGPIFGYNSGVIHSRVHTALINGTATSYPPSIERGLAQLLGEVFPDVEQVRFARNGSDVCAAAVRLARAITGREHIAAFGYHGFASEFVHAPQNRGVPQYTQNLVRWFEWGDVSMLRMAARDAACVILEVPPTDDTAETAKFLYAARQIANEAGALFILDEIVTGFRLGLRGAAGYYDVRPDLYCWGKALANGFGLSALGGRAELMQEFQNGVFFSGTFFDDPIAISAAYATVQRMKQREKDIFPQLWEMGGRLKNHLNSQFAAQNVKARCFGQAPRTVLQFDNPEQHVAFNLAALEEGVLFDRPNFITMPYTEKIHFRVEAAVERALSSRAFLAVA